VKDENSIQDGVSMTSLEESSSRGGVSRKTVTGCESGQYVAGKRKDAFGQNPR